MESLTFLLLRPEHSRRPNLIPVYWCPGCLCRQAIISHNIDCVWWPSFFLSWGRMCDVSELRNYNEYWNISCFLRKKSKPRWLYKPMYHYVLYMPLSSAGFISVEMLEYTLDVLMLFLLLFMIHRASQWDGTRWILFSSGQPFVLCLTLSSGWNRLHELIDTTRTANWCTRCFHLFHYFISQIVSQLHHSLFEVSQFSH